MLASSKVSIVLGMFAAFDKSGERASPGNDIRPFFLDGLPTEHYLRLYCRGALDIPGRQQDAHQVRHGMTTVAHHLLISLF